MPPDVARRRDVAEVQLEIERVRVEVEKVRADLSRDIEKVRADMRVGLERMQAVQTRWAFVFWLSQIAVLGGLLLTILRALGQV